MSIEQSKGLILSSLRGGLTQQELANKSGVSRYTIIALEGNKHKASKRVLSKLACALGVSLVDLLFLAEGSNNSNSKKKVGD